MASRSRSIISCSATAVVVSRKLSGRASNHAAHSAWTAVSSASASFQRFVRLLDSSPALPDLAAAAVLAGYADQPHLTRECRALSGHTPAALHRLRRPA